MESSHQNQTYPSNKENIGEQVTTPSSEGCFIICDTYTISEDAFNELESINDIESELLNVPQENDTQRKSDIIGSGCDVIDNNNVSSAVCKNTKTSNCSNEKSDVESTRTDTNICSQSPVINNVKSVVSLNCIQAPQKKLNPPNNNKSIATHKPHNVQLSDIPSKNPNVMKYNNNSLLRPNNGDPRTRPMPLLSLPFSKPMTRAPMISNPPQVTLPSQYVGLLPTPVQKPLRPMHIPRALIPIPKSPALFPTPQYRPRPYNRNPAYLQHHSMRCEPVLHRMQGQHNFNLVRNGTMSFLPNPINVPRYNKSPLLPAIPNLNYSVPQKTNNNNQQFMKKPVLQTPVNTESKLCDQQYHHNKLSNQTNISSYNPQSNYNMAPKQPNFNCEPPKKTPLLETPVTTTDLTEPFQLFQAKQIQENCCQLTPKEYNEYCYRLHLNERELQSDKLEKKNYTEQQKQQQEQQAKYQNQVQPSIVHKHTEKLIASYESHPIVARTPLCEPPKKTPLLETPITTTDLTEPFQLFQATKIQENRRRLTPKEYNEYCYSLHLNEQELNSDKLEQKNYTETQQQQQAKYQNQVHPSIVHKYKHTDKQSASCESHPIVARTLLCEPQKKTPLLETPVTTTDLTEPFQLMQSKQVKENRRLTPEEYNEYCYRLHLNERELNSNKLEQTNYTEQQQQQQAKYQNQVHPSIVDKYKHTDKQSASWESHPNHPIVARTRLCEPPNKTPLLETPVTTIDLTEPFQLFQAKQVKENRRLTPEEYNEYCYRLHLNERELHSDKLEQKNYTGQEQHQQEPQQQQAKYQNQVHPSIVHKYRHTEKESASCESHPIVARTLLCEPPKKKPLLETPVTTIDLTEPFQLYQAKQVKENRRLTPEEYNEYCYRLHLNERELNSNKLEQKNYTEQQQQQQEQQAKYQNQVQPSIVDKYKHTDKQSASCESHPNVARTSLCEPPKKKPLLETPVNVDLTEPFQLNQTEQIQENYQKTPEEYIEYYYRLYLNEQELKSDKLEQRDTQQQRAKYQNQEHPSIVHKYRQTEQQSTSSKSHRIVARTLLPSVHSSQPKNHMECPEKNISCTRKRTLTSTDVNEFSELEPQFCNRPRLLCYEEGTADVAQANVDVQMLQSHPQQQQFNARVIPRSGLGDLIRGQDYQRRSDISE